MIYYKKSFLNKRKKQTNLIYNKKITTWISLYQFNSLESKMITINKFVLFVVTLPTIFVASQPIDTNTFPFSKVTIYVTNNMTNTQLTMYCKDKHHNFGTQTLKSGETYSFKFIPAYIFRRSLYFCHFSWNSESHYFDIYVQTRDQHGCDKDCYWHIKESGPCKDNAGGKGVTQCFHWKKTTWSSVLSFEMYADGRIKVIKIIHHS